MFWIGIVFFIVAIVAVGAAFAFHPDGAAMVAVGAAALGAGSWVIAAAHTVPTRNVGIVTQFSRPTGETTGAGLKFTWPWQDIDDWDASGQTYAHLGDHCVWLSIAAQRKACIPVQIEYASREERAAENWAAYKEVGDWSRFETFVNRRVEPQINAAMASVFADFDPLTGVDPQSGNAPAPNLNATYVKPLEAAVSAALGHDIQIRSVAFESPRYDKPTTDAIEAYGQKILEARNLVIEQGNANTRKAISETNAQVNQVTRCLEIAEKLAKEPGLCMTPVAATRPTS
jgi:hypothetical protein